MKKISAIFTALAFFALGLALAGCPADWLDDDDGKGGYTGGNADVIGAWQSTDATMVIGDGTWSLQSPGGNYSGTFYWSQNVLRLHDNANRIFDGQATPTGSALEVTIRVHGDFGLDTLTWSLTKSDGTTLKINNQSSKNFSSVEWGGTTLSASLTQGSNISKGVSAGQGYIYFKVESNNTTYRTQDVLIIEKGETFPFTFLDSTVCVDTATNSISSLGSL